MGSFDGYTREETPVAAPGKYRVAIAYAEEGISKSSGNPMIIVGLKLNGTNITVKDYIVKNEYFNRNMTKFYDSFSDIKEGDVNLLGWVGAMGAAEVERDERGYLKKKWYISAKEAEGLPAWEGNLPERQTITELSGFTNIDSDDELPF